MQLEAALAKLDTARRPTPTKPSHGSARVARPSSVSAEPSLVFPFLEQLLDNGFVTAEDRQRWSLRRMVGFVAVSCTFLWLSVALFLKLL